MKKYIVLLLIHLLPLTLFSQGGWIQKANFGGTARTNAVGFSIGNGGYIGTGYDGSAKSDFWKYESLTDEWIQKANFGGTPRSSAVGLSNRGKGYIGTGQHHNPIFCDEPPCAFPVELKSFWEYDTLSNSWTIKTDFGGASRLDAIGFTIDTVSYIGLGYNAETDFPSIYYNDFWEYNQSNNSWLQDAPFNGTSRSGAISFTINNKVYVGTGFDGAYKKDLWEYDPNTNTWTAKADFGGTARTGAVAFSINGKGYVGTGYDGTYKNDFWEYDPILDTWNQIADFAGTARTGAVAFSIGNKGYIGTGYDGSSMKQDFWEYNPNTISGNVQNVMVNFTDGSLIYYDFSNISVQLIENGNLIATTNAEANGDFEFNNLTGSIYSVVAVNTGGFTVQSKYDNVAVGSVLSNIRVPYDLVGQIKILVNEVQTQEFDASVFYNLVNYTQYANGYDESAVNNTLTNYSTLLANHQSIIEALGRLVIAQKALDEMSNDARDMCAEIAVSSFDLGESIYNLFTLKKKLLLLIENAPFVHVLTALFNNAFNFTSHILEDALIQGCNFIQDDATRAYTIATLQGVFDALRVMSGNANLGEWTPDLAKDIARDFASEYVAAQIYSHLYIPSTQYNVELAANNADQLNYSGTFDGAFDNVIDNSSDNSIVETGHQNTATTQNQIGTLRTVSNVAGTTSQISQITALGLTLTGFGGIANTVLAPLIVVATAVDAGASGWAIAKGANRTKHIKNELASATQQAFAFVSIDGQGYEVTSLGLSDAITDYNNQLTYINGLIAGNQRLAAINEMQTLIDLDSALQSSALEAIMPIYAASPFASMTDYDDTLNNIIVNDFAVSMQNRQAVGYALAAYILDSLTASVVTDLQNASNNAINANNQLSASIDNVNNELAGTIVPPHVSVIHANDFPALNLSTTYPLQVKFKNVGTSTASDLYAKLELHDGFTTTNDSVYIGSLAQDAIDSLTFILTTPNYDTTSYYTIVFNSPNTSSDGFGRALVTDADLVTGIKNETSEIRSLFCFPNPATQSVYFLNSINGKANYELYGALGNLLYSGTAIQGLNEINAEGFANGIYYLQLNDGQKIYSTRFVKQ